MITQHVSTLSGHNILDPCVVRCSKLVSAVERDPQLMKTFQPLVQCETLQRLNEH